MCPDKELLSTWLDGELPSPWKESLERHLSGCQNCTALVESMREIRRAISLDIQDLDFQAESAKARVLERLMSNAGARYKPGKRSFWSRKLALPLPALLAAFVLLAVLGLALFQSQGRNAELRLAIQKTGEMPASSVIPGNMDAILQYLSSQNNGVSVIFTLPSGTNMAEQGEPMIIREADWRGGGRE